MLNVHNSRYSRMRVFRYREKNCRFWSFARKSWVHILAYVTQWYSRYEILKHQNQIQNVLCLLLKKQCLNHPSSHNCQIFKLFQTKRLPIEKLIRYIILPCHTKLNLISIWKILWKIIGMPSVARKLPVI